jgi:putative acetyltransferase
VQPRGGPAEVQLLGDGDEIAQMAELDIHIRSILTETNGIFEVSVPRPHTERMDLTIRPLRNAGDAAAFRALNEEWIARYFVLEEQDRRQLDDPVAAYIDTGGEILIAELDGQRIGCVALVPDGTGAYELSKMAISPELRGRGAGRALLTAAIAHARELGASSLFLGSSTKLTNAVHLYEALGFAHVAPESLHMPYARADVFMKLELRARAAASR